MEDHLSSEYEFSNGLNISELLQLRHALVKDNNIEWLDKLDEYVRDLATSNPDRAADMFDALAASAEYDDRDAAAIYIKNLFSTLPDRATPVLLKLLQDNDGNVRTTAFDTLEELVEHDMLTLDEGARFAQAFHAANTTSMSTAGTSSA
jgi:HEAT repeat